MGTEIADIVQMRDASEEILNFILARLFLISVAGKARDRDNKISKQYMRLLGLPRPGTLLSPFPGISALGPIGQLHQPLLGSCHPEQLLDTPGIVQQRCSHPYAICSLLGTSVFN